MSKKKTEEAANTTTEIVTTSQATAIAPHEDFSDYAGQGFEGQTAEDLSIPFLALLQAGSPQLTVEGTEAKAGMIINTVTEELFEGKKGVLFVPVVTQHVYVEWIPRDQGGGYVGQHAINSKVVADAKAASTKFGKYRVGENDLQETYYLYGLLTNEEGDTEMVVVAFTSTKIGVYRKLNSKLSAFTKTNAQGRKYNPPLFSHLCRLSAVLDKNNKGTFYNWEIKPANGEIKNSTLTTEDPRFLAALRLRDLLKTGAAKVNYDNQNKANGGAADADENGSFF
jgi:hypothetical protein